MAGLLAGVGRPTLLGARMPARLVYGGQIPLAPIVWYAAIQGGCHSLDHAFAVAHVDGQVPGLKHVQLRRPAHPGPKDVRPGECESYGGILAFGRLHRPKVKARGQIRIKPPRSTAPVARDDRAASNRLPGALRRRLARGKPPCLRNKHHDDRNWKSAARAREVMRRSRSYCRPRRRHGCSLAAPSSAFLTVRLSRSLAEVKATPLTMRPTTNSSPIAQMFAGRRRPASSEARKEKIEARARVPPNRVTGPGRG